MNLTLETTNLCACVDEQTPEYVLFTGGIAGINDSTSSERDAKSLDRGADMVQLDRN
jgi:hypothetical protein